MTTPDTIWLIVTQHGRRTHVACQTRELATGIQHSAHENGEWAASDITSVPYQGEQPVGRVWVVSDYREPVIATDCKDRATILAYQWHIETGRMHYYDAVRYYAEQKVS